jgi:hypothetical protein
MDQSGLNEMEQSTWSEVKARGLDMRHCRPDQVSYKQQSMNNEQEQAISEYGTNSILDHACQHVRVQKNLSQGLDVSENVSPRLHIPILSLIVCRKCNRIEEKGQK